MGDSTPKATDGPSARRGGILDAVLGEQAARAQEKATEIALRNAENDARHNRVRNTVSTVFMMLVTLAALFGSAMGCLAMWNAVVG
jgi:hypothetical protein